MKIDMRNDDDLGDYLYEKLQDKKLEEMHEMKLQRRLDKVEQLRQEVNGWKRDYDEANKL